MRKRVLLAAALCAALATPAAAEPLGSHFELTPFGGWTWLDGEISKVNGVPLTDDVYFGGRLGYMFTSLLGAELAAGVTPTVEAIPDGRDVDFFHGSGNLLLTPWNGRRGGPFLFGGVGMAQTKVSGAAETQSDMSLEYGGGLRLWLSDAVGLRMEVRSIYSKADGGPGVGDVHLNDMVAGGGITFAIGGSPRDTDGDGVADKHDRCPDTIHGARVDANGCPTDGDGDGVFDGIDQCEGTPKGATVDARGCPADADDDDVLDGIDTCPNTPKGARVDATGCPADADADSVFDGIDQCENTPRGCRVDEKGCPIDTDGDGVCDAIDMCPDTSPGLQVDAKGCPVEWIERQTELLDTGMMRFNDIRFETNKADLKPESYASLDVVGQVLMAWPQLKIEIGGHTDGRGSAATNQKLSERRAESVRKYLLDKFPNLTDSQYTIKGYGESKPVVPNKDETSWALNRRVEFVVLNKDVLKKEIEKRRLLQKGETAPADTTKK